MAADGVVGDMEHGRLAAPLFTPQVDGVGPGGRKQGSA